MDFLEQEQVETVQPEPGSAAYKKQVDAAAKEESAQFLTTANGTRPATPVKNEPGQQAKPVMGTQPTRPPQSATPKNTPVGWGNSKPEFLPNMPSNMPGSTDWKVTEDQTVEGRMRGLMGEDNALNQQIRAQTQLQASRAGMQNSLMAISAGEQRVIDQAFSIASQDAQTFARSAEFNALMKNQFSQAEQAFMHTAMLSDQNFRHARLLQTEQINGQLSQIAAQIGGQLQLSAQEQDHWVQRAGLSHAQTLETMELNQVFDIERMGFGHELNVDMLGRTHEFNVDMLNRTHDNTLERDFMQTGNQMILNESAANLQDWMSDRDMLRTLEINSQQYSHQSQMTFASLMASLGQSQIDAFGTIGSSGAKPAQQSDAMRQTNQAFESVRRLIQSMFSLPSGPAAAASGQGANDYLSYGP